MATPEQHVNRPVEIINISRPILEDTWGQAMLDYGNSTLGDSVSLVEPGTLEVGLLNKFELSRRKHFSVQQARTIIHGMAKLKEEFFDTEITVPVKKVLVKRPRAIYAGLEDDQTLSRERQAILKLLGRVAGLRVLNPEKFFFNIYLGKVNDPDRIGDVIKGFEDNGLPPEVTLDTTKIRFNILKPDE